MTASISNLVKSLKSKVFKVKSETIKTGGLEDLKTLGPSDSKTGFLSSLTNFPKKYLNKFSEIYVKNKSTFDQKASPEIKLNDEDIICAKITLESYVEKNKRAKTLDTYTLDENLSNEYNCVYFDQNKKICIIGYRGTVFTDLKDVSSDAQIVLDIQGIDPRVKDALNTYDNVKRIYQGYQMQVCGHSLGGTLSYIVAKHRNPMRCVVFNPGASLNTFFIQMLEDTFRHVEWANNTYTYKILGDFISTLAFVGHTKVFTIGAKDPLALHTIENFRPKLVQST